jgi:hypothetical protein
MSCEDAAIIEEARVFLDELLAQGILRHLLNHGTFPDGWPSRYLAFVDRVAQGYESDRLPREVMAVIYSASVYCTKRYHDWQRLTGGVNDATQALVDQVRWSGDRLVLGRFWRSGDLNVRAK